MVLLRERQERCINAGAIADLSVLSADYFAIPEEEIKQLESVLTIVGGKIVYANELFARLSPPPLPVSPDWSPVKKYDGYFRPPTAYVRESRPMKLAAVPRWKLWYPRHWWDFGCDCFAC